MKHYSTEEWIDYVNLAGSEERHNEMQVHLDSGCKRCAKTVRLWQKVRASAVQEPTYQPPAGSLSAVKAAFGAAGYSRRRKLGDVVADVLFDSFREPTAVGARSAGSATRQMLYRADPYEIDLQIEAKPGESRLSVTGQVMDVRRPGIVASEVPVILSNRRGEVVQAVTNRFGEFRGEVENVGDLELRIPGPGGKNILVSLREVLGRISRRTRGT